MFRTKPSGKGNIGVSATTMQRAIVQQRLMDDYGCQYCINCDDCVDCVGCSNCQYLIMCQGLDGIEGYLPDKQVF